MHSAVATFGEYLTGWMEQNGYTPESLGLIMGKNGPNVIARLMHDRLGYQRCARFITELSDAIGPLEESILKAMRECVEVNRYGKALYTANRDFMRMLKKESFPGEAETERLMQTVLDWSEGMKIKVLSMAVTHPCAFHAVSRIYDAKSDVFITQLMEEEQIQQLFALMGSALHLAFRKNYELYSVKNAAGVMIKNTILIKREDGRQLLILLREGGEHRLELKEDSPLFDFCLSVLKSNDSSAVKINRNIRSGNPETLEEFLEECFRHEKEQSIYHLKSDIGIEYMPVELLVRKFTAWAKQNDERFLPLVGRLEEIFRKRHENILKKNAPTYLIMSREGMLKFVKTGVMYDQPFCLPPFSPEERWEILRYLSEMARTVPAFSPLFLTEEGVREDYSFIGYGSGELLVCNSTADYNLSDYTEVILDSKPLMEHFAGFFTGILIKNCATGKKAALEYLKYLETQIPSE